MQHFTRENAKKWFATLSLPGRITLALVALLVAILAGGTITAYGGTLLVLLLWAVCVCGLVWLLKTVMALTFPGQDEKNGGDTAEAKAFWRAFIVGSLVGFAVIAALVLYRRVAYSEDAINYFAKQNLLLGSFAQNGFYGVHTLAENLLAADYKMFINLFVSLPYLLLPRTINSFMLCYTVTCFVPMWFAVLLCAKKLPSLMGWDKLVRPTLYYALCMTAAVLWPVFLWPATHGMPDAFGLVFVACILLLTVGFNFDYEGGKLPWARLIALFGATFALVITRRWYMYWILAYYLAYGVLVLWRAARKGRLVRVLRNLVCFAVPAVLGIVLPLVLTFRTILTTDYKDIYGSYYGGGFVANLQLQLAKQGILPLLLCAAGVLALLWRRQSRGAGAVLVLSCMGAMALFTHTQSMGDHQTLLLAPLYLGGLFALAALLCANSSGRTASLCGAVGMAVVLAANFGNSLRWPGAYLPTGLLSGESMDLTRRDDIEAMAQVTNFVLDNCTPDETVYINIDSDGYSGSTFAFSDAAHPRLQSMILWENSVPSTHGFPTGIWSSRYVMVTDKLEEGGLVGGVNTALRTDTPAASHYNLVTQFNLANGIVLYCYERVSQPDAAEAAYFEALFAEYDARWPELYSVRIEEYMNAL